MLVDELMYSACVVKSPESIFRPPLDSPIYSIYFFYSPLFVCTTVSRRSQLVSKPIFPSKQFFPSNKKILLRGQFHESVWAVIYGQKFEKYVKYKCVGYFLVT
jgi:hypothetical protein